ncbi:MAG: hypothetical protein JSS36_02420 [Proteobacteria bacterium]|nr:hypothetical protein [Pseudomonadota bacterium]
MRRLAVLALVALGACAVAVPPHLISGATAGSPVPARVALRLAPVEGEAAPELAAPFATALAAALQRHGVQVTTNAPYRIDVALALRPDSSGITADRQGTIRTLHWASAPRHPHLFDRCRARRLRVSLTGTPADAAPAWQGSGELAGCAIAPAALATLADQFAVALTR